jgi:hypothetical protein
MHTAVSWIDFKPKNMTDAIKAGMSAITTEIIIAGTDALSRI